MDGTPYQMLQPTQKAYWLTLLVLLCAVVLGGYCAYTVEHVGHKITGMNNRIVWGLPHVFAISLILTASGALNGATLSSVFSNNTYKPWARLSVALAIALLTGGLVVLVLDLGRPDRLFIAMTTYNFRSIFSWNIFLYVGFIGVGAVYLWTMLERRFNRHVKAVGFLALFWRLVLTTGTGSIFGFLVGRSALDSAIIAPLFVALSFVMGSAVFTLVVTWIARWQGAVLSSALVNALGRLLFWCLLALLYFSVVHHLTNLNAAEHHADEKFVLAGPHSWLFWLGHIGFGVLFPLWLLRRTTDNGRSTGNNNLSDPKKLLLACSAALTGGVLLVYLIVIGSQSKAQLLFPGKTVTSSTFGDIGNASYKASPWEWGLGIGGVSLALLLLFLLLRILPLSPVRNTDAELTPGDKPVSAGQ